MSASYRLERFDRREPPPARIVAGMHARLLPTSPAAKLGEGFLETFFYGTLVEEGAIHGTTAWVDGEPAGFITATADSAGFMRTVLRRRFPRVLRAGVAATLKRPSRAIAALEILQVMAARDPRRPGEAEGEILSMGIEKAFRTPGFISDSGHRVALDLLDRELERLRGLGRSRVRAVVEDDNLPAKLFYRGVGWSMTRSELPGWHTPAVEFALVL